MNDLVEAWIAGEHSLWLQKFDGQFRWIEIKKMGSL